MRLNGTTINPLYKYCFVHFCFVNEYLYTCFLLIIKKLFKKLYLNSGWKCSKCDMKENLWLNLTDGSILCGRRFWDGTGGNNHALEHYETTKYPLAVKLGTITPKVNFNVWKFIINFLICLFDHFKF